MKNQIDYKLILYILIPFLVADVINRVLVYGFNMNSSLVITTSEVLLFLWKYVAVVFWFWVGRQFGNLRTGKLMNFILGNSLWGVSMILFIWQFIFVSDVNRNFDIAGRSQNYMFGFVYWGSKAIILFADTINTTTLGRVAYLMMFIVFTAGFISVSNKTIKTN